MNESVFEGKVVSLNVGLPKTVEYHGKTITTGIYKFPVETSLSISKTNIDGDGQADLHFHGGADKAVYAYSLQHYAYWQNQLDRSQMAFGQFGENLTLSGMDERRVRIGDYLKIGSAVLQVSEPRVPCYKLTMRMEAGDNFSQVFLKSRRVGFYLRVIESGVIAPDDDVCLLGTMASAPTIDDFVRITQTADRSVEELRSILQAPMLSLNWKRSIRHMISAELRKEQPAWAGQRAFAIVSKTQETPDVSSFKMRPRDDSTLPPWLPGQHVMLTPPGQSVSRCYSLSSSVGQPDAYMITVKRVVGEDGAVGQVSGWLHLANVGAEIHLSAPKGSFHPDPGSSDPLVLIAGGVGITPLAAMVESLAGQVAPVVLLHMSRDVENQVFAQYLLTLAQTHNNFRYHPIYSDRPELDEELILELLDLGQLDDPDVFICGPGGFMDAMKALLEGAGVPEDAIHIESFSGAAKGSGGVMAMPGVEPSTVTFARSQITTQWTGEHYSLLDLAEAEGVNIDFGCRAGSCRRCEAVLEAGSVAYIEPVEEPASGRVLLCCTAPTGDIILDV